MSDLLMTTWDGGGPTQPLMSVARALVARGHRLRILADPVLRADVEATGAEFVSWTRAPHRHERSYSDAFVRDWGVDPAEGLARMRDTVALGPAAAYAADTRAELERHPPRELLIELILFAPQVDAEAVGVPYVVLNPTINVVPAPTVPPFGSGLTPATSDEDRRHHEELRATMVASWERGCPLSTRPGPSGTPAARAHPRPGPLSGSDARDDQPRLRLSRPPPPDRRPCWPTPR